MTNQSKSTLWTLLNKYENAQFLSFCDSISRVIQDTQSDQDILNIYSNYINIDTTDANTLNSVIGDQLDAVLF